MDFAGANLSETLQNVVIVASFLLSAYTFWRDERARKVGNLIAITQLYRDVWNTTHERPSLFRILRSNVDLEREPPTNEEEVFISSLIFVLDAAYETMKAGMLVRLPGLKRDVREFFTLPIPMAIWEKIKPLQNERLVRFVESALGSQA